MKKNLLLKSNLAPGSHEVSAQARLCAAWTRRPARGQLGVYLCARLYTWSHGCVQFLVSKCTLERVAVRQGHVDSPHKDSARGKRQPWWHTLCRRIHDRDFVAAALGCLLRGRIVLLLLIFSPYRQCFVCLCLCAVHLHFSHLKANFSDHSQNSSLRLCDKGKAPPSVVCCLRPHPL